MTTDYKALCAELVRIADALDSGAPLVSNQGQALDGYSALAAFRDVAHRARAALAEETAAPTVMEIIKLSEEIEAAGLGQVDFARAVLARWGRQPAPPADGEVVELAAALRNDAINCTCSTLTSADLRRAAELLQRQVLPEVGE